MTRHAPRTKRASSQYHYSSRVIIVRTTMVAWTPQRCLAMNQHTHVRIPRACCHLPCPTTSGLGRLQCLPMRPICRQQTASFSGEMIRAPLCNISISSSMYMSWLNATRLWMVWYTLSDNPVSGINIAMILVDCIGAYLLTNDSTINNNTGREWGGSGNLALIPQFLSYNNQMMWDRNMRQWKAGLDFVLGRGQDK